MNRPLVTAVTLLGLISLLSAQQPKVPAPHKPVPQLAEYPKKWPKPATLRSMVGGLWMIDANFKSSIYLRNNINTASITAIPILYLSNGTKYVLPKVDLDPSGVAVLSVNNALRDKGIAPFASLSGYVEVQYTSFYDPICVVVNNVDTEHSLMFTSSLRPLSRLTHPAEAGAPRNHVVDGMWWKEEASVSGFVALSNITAQPIVATVQVTDEGSKSLGEHTITVTPHGTKIVNLPELQTSAGANGGLHIVYLGAEDSLAINGHLQDPSTGYSATMPFRTAPPPTEKVKSSSFSELGLMTGVADPMMSFPVGTEFTPFSVIRNIASEAVTVRPNIWWMQGGKPVSAQLKWITLAPFQTLDLNMKSLLSAAGLGAFNGSVSVILDLEGKPHSLLMASGSVDRTKTYVFQVLPRTIEESASKSISYWSTGNGEDTMVNLWNPADEAQDFIFTLFYSGGHYDLPVHLDPRASRTFNISEIIENQLPDTHGNTVPATVHEGSARIAGTQSERQHILVAIDAGTYSVRKGTCSYYCIDCDGYVDAFIGIAPFGVSKGGAHQLDVYAYWDGGGSASSLGAGSTWSSSNNNVATVSGGKVTGVAQGSITISGVADDEPIYWDDCAYDPECYSQDENMGGSGNGTVIEITSVDPSILETGSTGTMDIVGYGFSGVPGTPSVQLDGTGISVTSPSVLNDSTILADYSVSSSASAGTQNLTVSFPGGDGGTSAVSNSYPVTVDIPACSSSLASVTVDQITPKSLPDYDHPTYLTGVGILARMKVAPSGTNYNGAVLVETVTPTSNSCPSNIQQYTSFPTITAANNSTFTVGSSAYWEGSQFASITDDFYDSHKLLVNINVLGLTSVTSCVAKATQTYTCGGRTVGTFTLTNTYTKGTLNGNTVTNVSTTKQ